ncbi:MAG: endolytic transglycosylase MltG [Oscillospiraceae bacterium]
MENNENYRDENAEEVNKENNETPSSDESENESATNLNEMSDSNESIEPPVFDVSDNADGYDDAEEPKKNKKKRRKKKHKALTAIIVAFIIIAVSVTLALSIIFAGIDFFGINKETEKIEIDIPEGATTSEIIDILHENGIIDYPIFLKAYLKTRENEAQFNPGCYELYPSMGYMKLVATLESEDNIKNIVDVTIPEGKTIDEIAAILEENEVCTADEFIEAINKTDYGYKFEKKLIDSAETYYAREGYVFPDTYKFYKGGIIDNVVANFYKNFDRKFTDEMYQRAAELSMDLNEVITLASMIQQEAGSAEQMAQISSVFWNRLNSPDFTRLQSDPTKNYVENVIKAGIKESQYGEYQSMFEAYDTYQCQGLPAGPICNPGLDAINAALYPAQTDYYYFCHDVSTGEVYFASNLSDHNYNLRRAGLA